VSVHTDGGMVSRYDMANRTILRRHPPPMAFTSHDRSWLAGAAAMVVFLSWSQLLSS
jgi:hypothetical protein